ncbi:hypothetical protein RO3G_14917 [Rhizopus delemar RA 99-880]|uniref:AAA+ ATPase domain-containing protein n=1 Tax=Rhizopus delemar (strain RA 99-880 / ATCC MYA-4621 / FGSC 9543 / NRRL 43880) TaxID=246409 RepID=I1CP26_RHIO9|nr:hypothetical protein RO3G_14917 [Rhizopus delemar RA 99-880]|eukprot:EIE90206.1 hypothetical protein RO3G_14917 [Rhizopus delemar RA 99-880]
MDSNNNKRDYSTSFFDDDDEDYLIAASMEMEKGQEGIISLDDFINQKEEQPPLEVNYAQTVPLQNSFLDAVESMDIDDSEPLFDLTKNDNMLFEQHTTFKRQVTKDPVVKEQKKKVDYTRAPVTGSFVMATCPRTGASLYLPSKTQARDVSREIEESKRQRKKKKVVEKDSSGELWVDRYRPKTYSDLTGDQSLFREVLKWVKQWDYCVFRKLPPQETQRDKAMRQYEDARQQNTRRFRRFDPQETNDPLLRPEKKILLLSGPPGFGKTTVAHVMARMAGYNIIEINASDDRTGDVVKTKIKSALEMQAIIRDANSSETGERTMTMNQKPNLVIIDEIDGVSSKSGNSDSFISQLVQLATVEIGGEQSKKSKQKQKPLLRPIICICNDVYAPALRPLRSIAQVMHFREVPMITVAKRLGEICENEGLETDLGTLRMLAETADGDLRSCINTLQYIRSTSRVFTKNMLNDGGIGKKDSNQYLFSIWENIFCTPKSSISSRVEDQGKYVDRLVQAITSNGEIERIMQGCHESYPLMRFHDVAMEKCVQMNEWFDFYDQINNRINERQEYDLYKYLPYPAVNFHRFFAGTTTQEHRVEYPKVDYQVYSAKKSFENLIDMFLAGIKPTKRRYLNRNIVANELVPHLMYIISPEMKQANKTLFKAEEKAMLARLVNTMIDYGLSYVSEKTKEGQIVLKLEPPVEQFLYFELSKPKSLLPRQYAVRQLIASEIEEELIERKERLLAMSQKGKEATTTTATTPKKIKAINPTKKKVVLNFFNQPIVSKESDMNKMEVIKPAIKYIYHEGSSNAVKTPMKIKQFL